LPRPNAPITPYRAALKETFSNEEIKDFVGLLDRLETFLRQPIDEILDEVTAE